MPIDQYASIRPFFPSSTPTGLNNEDAPRVMAYDAYEAFYWNIPDSFKIIPRSADSAPLYLPSARSIVEASHRFLAVDWDFLVDPRVGTSEDQNTVKSLLQNMWKRELMYGKFSNQKRNLLIRGDAMWHVTADPSKPQGERVSLHELHPGQYFPIFDPENADRIIGCHIVDTIDNPQDTDNQVSRRQTYRKQEDGTITSSLTLFEVGRWDDRDPDTDTEQVAVLRPEEPLPPEIRTLPVYRIRNMAGSGMWGSSELRGIESVLKGVQQAVSDQDLALALQGLGVYWTNAGPPRDAQGNAAPFTMGPGEVIEVPGGTEFGRVSGISGSLPGIEHMNFILGQASEAVGVPDIARGRVDVTVAESGISLYLQMAPLLAKNSEKELEMLGVYDHLLYDLVKMWLPAYEGITADIAVSAVSVVGDPMPQNREAQIAEILTLVTSVPPLITIEMAQAKLAALGYEFPAGAATTVLDEARNINAARALSDPYANRYREELPEDEQGTPAA